MITRPAALTGLQLENGLAQRILDDTGNEPGALALMAYTLDTLYGLAEQRGERCLTLADYRTLAGVQGAIGKRAEEIYGGLSKPAQERLARVFRELVDVDERGTVTRQRASIHKFADDDAALNLIQAFTNARLLVTDKERRSPTIEVAHEALFRHWTRLADWIDETQQDLRVLRQMSDAAAEWKAHGENPAYLWPDERLQPVYSALKRLNIDIEEDLSRIEQAFIRPEADRLLAELRDLTTSHQRRSTIGERLSRIGDPRPGTGLQSDGVPDIAWCFVPGGTTTLEDRSFTLKIEPFYISKYPVTYIQFQSFIDDPNGYHNEIWWEGLEKPAKPRTQRLKFSNHPNEKANWYEAVAFCRWLTATLPIKYLPYEEPSPRGHRIIRLPTEWEWQIAATGGDPTYEYPWGTEWDTRKANTVESGIGRVTAVGMYPDGISPVGALDMCGNVWEWCLNAYHKPTNINIESSVDRVMRGGAWYMGHLTARSKFRMRDLPNPPSVSQGLRVVFASPLGDKANEGIENAHSSVDRSEKF